jgi:hypothetical protein
LPLLISPRRACAPPRASPRHSSSPRCRPGSVPFGFGASSGGRSMRGSWFSVLPSAVCRSTACRRRGPASGPAPAWGPASVPASSAPGQRVPGLGPEPARVPAGSGPGRGVGVCATRERGEQQGWEQQLHRSFLRASPAQGADPIRRRRRPRLRAWFFCRPPQPDRPLPCRRRHASGLETKPASSSLSRDPCGRRLLLDGRGRPPRGS